MIKKAICVIFDGLGDRPIGAFGGKTPLEAANTPNFDSIAKKSLCGVMQTLGRGVRPGSDVSHLAIFGYPMAQYYTGRGPIEVAGLGIHLQEGDVAFRGNFGTVDENWNILDRRVGRIRVVDEFAAALDGLVIDGIECIVKPGTAHRAGVVLRGKGLSAAISDADPHEEGKPVLEIKPLDDSKEAAFTAQVLNKFLRKSYEILDAMDANKVRTAAGAFPANILLLRGAGLHPSMPKFNEKYDLTSCCIAGGGLYKGIGAFLGMDLIEVDGATGLPDTDIEAKFKKALEMLDTYNFVFCHVKATDSLAEDGNPEGKKAFIEKADKAAALLTNLPDDVLLVVTADHSTACELKAHSADPVPVLFSNPSVRIDAVAEFGERAFASGGFGYVEGKDIMPQIMNLMGKLHLIGA
jgi:2,3-bisphosphoglycerate-independent phosphoglycerate mutase